MSKYVFKVLDVKIYLLEDKLNELLEKYKWCVVQYGVWIKNTPNNLLLILICEKKGDNVVS